MTAADVPLDGLDFFTGKGNFAAVSTCRDQTIGHRAATLAHALREVESFNTWGCGEGCQDQPSRHRAVALTNGSNR